MESNWTIHWEKSASKQFDKLPQTIQKKIRQHLDMVKTAPFSHGKALKGNKRGYWCHRIEDYRILCKLNPSSQTILVGEIGHRRNVYY